MPVTEITLPGGRPRRTRSSTPAIAATRAGMSKSASTQSGSRRVTQNVSATCEISSSSCTAETPAPTTTTRCAAELLRRDVVGDVQLAAAEALLPGVVRPERSRPRAGRVDHIPCRPGSAVRLDQESPARVVVDAAHALHVHGPQDVEREPLLVVGEVRRKDVAARGDGVGRRDREPRQLVDAVDRRHPQRRPAVLPRAAGRGIRVEDEERRLCAGRTLRRCEPAALQMIGGGEPRLPRADHDDVDGCGLHAGLNSVRPAGIPAGRTRSILDCDLS